MINNILNFKDPFQDRPIYRVMHMKRLMEIFDSRRLILRQPHKWDEPFENYCFRQTATEGRLELTYAADIYFQSWSEHEENEKMWKMYAPDKMGVKVKTTVHKLFSQFWSADETGSEPHLSCFLGKVNYVDRWSSPEDLLAGMADDSVPCGELAARTLLVKRADAAHEAEVRLLFVDHYENQNGRLLPRANGALLNTEKAAFGFTIDPLTLFDELVIDPRMAEDAGHSYADHLRKLGFAGAIFQSALSTNVIRNEPSGHYYVCI